MVFHSRGSVKPFYLKTQDVFSTCDFYICRANCQGIMETSPTLEKSPSAKTNQTGEHTFKFRYMGQGKC
ncbi:hypothetical protein NITGR_530015 [Nitrospina gracilis 3/211]|uniref:Uncharacterized protein n=1 Tax=Nitrospina gracilis (strain 3/211) TaxID=1266370 RepID=M1YZS1_NITG3|nr:hypothetical protein NITGR_530015 [Nitrospina gracilis 3/211]